MERLLLEGAKAQRGRGEFLLPLARLHEELGRSDEALRTWRALFFEDPSPEAAYQILRRGRGADTGAIRNKIEARFSEKARAAVDDLLERGPTPPRTPLRHLAICGASYSGSTLFGRFLDSFDGFHDIGESHWLIDQKELTDGKRQIDFFTAPPSPTRRYCRQCGEDCRALSTDFRIELQLCRSQWYARIAERLDKSILVSSDKNIAKYLSLDPVLRFDAVVLFKAPSAAWHSVYKRLLPADADALEARLKRYMAIWIREYQNALAMKTTGKKLFLAFDTLVHDPERAVARLLEACDLPRGQLDLAKPMKGRHSIGGNDAFVAASSKTEHIAIRSDDDTTLPNAHRRLIDENTEMTALFDQLSARSAAVFGGG
ncbi:MAG: hypothetical protein ACR2RE_19955 [Geminicoccaceae bacterium]